MITETQLISNKQSSRTHVRCFASIDAVVRCTLPQLLDVCGLIRCDFKNRTKHVFEENEQCETDKQPNMCQVVRDAMDHLTLDMADAVIGRGQHGRGCHGVTMLAW